MRVRQTSARPQPFRPNASRRPQHLGLFAAGGGMFCAMAAVVAYLLWPTWQAGAFSGPRQLPITVGGMLFNVPSDAIPMRLQRRAGSHRPRLRVSLAVAAGEAAARHRRDRRGDTRHRRPPAAVDRSAQ